MFDWIHQVGKYKVDNFGAVQMLGQRVALSAAQDLFYVNDTARRSHLEANGL